MAQFKIEQWLEVCSSFSSFFNEVHGAVHLDEDAIAFASPPSTVLTGLKVFKSGVFGATMPLHAVDSRIEHILFDTEAHSITLSGSEFEYTYRVPPQLIQKRSDEHAPE